VGYGEGGGTPNIFDIGLSKEMLDIVAGGKSVRTNKAENIPIISVARVAEESEVTMNASPVLRLSSKLTETSASPDVGSVRPEDDISQVEITPGLVVRRPGSSLRSRDKSGEVPPPSTPRAAAAAPPADPNATPEMPTLKTIDLSKYGAAAKSTAGLAPPVVVTRPTEEKVPISRLLSAASVGSTPETPDLRTVDVKNLLREAGPAPVVLEPVLAGVLQQPRHHQRGAGPAVTPETPDLRTVDVKKLVNDAGPPPATSAEESEVMRQRHLGMADTPELPELSIMLDRPIGDSTTPDTPQLSTTFFKR